MPVDPWPVNDGPGGAVNWPKHGGWMPPLAIPSLEVELDLRTAHEYGLSAARRPAKPGKTGPMRRGLPGEFFAPKPGLFELTFSECEAYITPSGALSAYSAIARL